MSPDTLSLDYIIDRSVSEDFVGFTVIADPGCGAFDLIVKDSSDEPAGTMIFVSTGNGET